MKEFKPKRYIEKSPELNRKIRKKLLVTGCGDTGCQFVRPKGMATNGGCRCIDHVVSMVMEHIVDN